MKVALQDGSNERIELLDFFGPLNIFFSEQFASMLCRPVFKLQLFFCMIIIFTMCISLFVSLLCASFSIFLSDLNLVGSVCLCVIGCSVMTLLSDSKYSILSTHTLKAIKHSNDLMLLYFANFLVVNC